MDATQPSLFSAPHGLSKTAFQRTRRMQVLRRWMPAGARCTFKGVPVADLSRDELLGLVGYLSAKLVDTLALPDDDLDVLTGVR